MITSILGRKLKCLSLRPRNQKVMFSDCVAMHRLLCSSLKVLSQKPFCDRGCKDRVCKSLIFNALIMLL